MVDETGSGAVGRSLRALREAHALAPADIAARVGISCERVGAIEAGRCLPTAAVLLRLSDLFEVEPGYFFGTPCAPPLGAGEDRPGALVHLAGEVDEETLDLLEALTQAVRKAKP